MPADTYEIHVLAPEDVLRLLAAVLEPWGQPCPARCGEAIWVEQDGEYDLRLMASATDPAHQMIVAEMFAVTPHGSVLLQVPRGEVAQLFSVAQRMAKATSVDLLAVHNNAHPHSHEVFRRIAGRMTFAETWAHAGSWASSWGLGARKR